MTREFETQALCYVLGEMDERQRAAFEEKLARFPAARAAVADCGESVAALRHQASDVPFLGDVVRAQVGLVIQSARESLQTCLSRQWTQLWRNFSRS